MCEDFVGDKYVMCGLQFNRKIHCLQAVTLIIFKLKKINKIVIDVIIIIIMICLLLSRKISNIKLSPSLWASLNRWLNLWKDWLPNCNNCLFVLNPNLIWIYISTSLIESTFAKGRVVDYWNSSPYYHCCSLDLHIPFDPSFANPDLLGSATYNSCRRHSSWWCQEQW